MEPEQLVDDIKNERQFLFCSFVLRGTFESNFIRSPREKILLSTESIFNFVEASDLFTNLNSSIQDVLNKAIMDPAENYIVVTYQYKSLTLTRESLNLMLSVKEIYSFDLEFYDGSYMLYESLTSFSYKRFRKPEESSSELEGFFFSNSSTLTESGLINLIEKIDGLINREPHKRDYYKLLEKLLSKYICLPKDLPRHNILISGNDILTNGYDEEEYYNKFNRRSYYSEEDRAYRPDEL